MSDLYAEISDALQPFCLKGAGPAELREALPAILRELVPSDRLDIGARIDSNTGALTVWLNQELASG